MNHRDAYDLNTVAAYIELRLDAEERNQFERHLVGCAECRETLAAYARAAKASPAGATLGRAMRSGSLLPATFAAAAVLVLAVGVTFYIRWGGPGPAPVDNVQQPASAPAAPAGPAASGPVVSPAPALRQPATTSNTRGSERRIGDKTFHLEAGVWIDEAYDPLALLPRVDVQSGVQRADVLQREPALAQYLALGPRVTVVFSGRVYRFDVR